MKKNILIFLSFIVLAGNLYGRDVVMAVASYAPFIILEDESKVDTDVSGFCIDVMNLFQERYPEYHLVFKNYPSGRARNMFDKGLPGLDISFTSPLFISEEALQHFKYAGTVAKTEDKVVTTKNSPLHYNTPGDLYGKRVGVILGYGYGEFDALFDAGTVIADRVTNHSQNIVKLNAGRIDAYFGNIHVTPYYMKELNLNPSDFVFSEASLFGFEYGPFVTNRDPALLRDLSAFIETIKASGELEGIINKYIK